MKQNYALIALLFTIALNAQPAVAPSAPVKPPSISTEQRAQFFKAQSQLQFAADTVQAAQRTAQDKQAVYEAIVKELKAACGDKDFELQMDSAGDPTCVAKSAAQNKPVEQKK